MPQQLVEVESYVSRAVALVGPLDVERVALADATGRVLAEPVRALLASPAFDNSAMDGFAVRRADVLGAGQDSPRELAVVGDVAAGPASAPVRVGPGQAARIMTGAALPEGADAVVPVELTDARAFTFGATAPTRVTILSEPAPGAHVRRRAEDADVGDLVLPAGRRLGPRDLAATAAAGYGNVPVRHRARVGVVVTGDELVPPGEAPGPGQLPESNGVLLASWLRGRGAVPTARVVPDDAAALRRVLDHLAPRVDLLLTAGGVSAGAFDVVREVLGDDDVTFAAVAMQPGKPQACGRWRGVPVLAVPGNPVSAFVSAEVIVRPVLAALHGHDDARRPERRPAATGWRCPPGRRQYLPAVVDDDGVRPAARRGSGSHLVASLAAATALAVVPADVDEVRPGDVVDVLPL
ncbi:gephyrin-like molybdotransferase Glp [Beutenbergia cavernae]|uniref:molybdopterin molybdotransferase MoeA n=1 Tax=Beutenbergia cavernae TaxID=84757 RepID=UPI0006818506|nr:gephyrin-like molybdotransferase Glp [Beutenbergia cavernae]